MTRTVFARWALLAPLAVAALFATATGARADTFDPTRPPESSLIGKNPVVLMPGASGAIARTEMIKGTDSIVLPFIVPGGMQGGILTVTLADLGWPGLMSSLSFAASTSTSLLAQLAAPGSVTFNIADAGTYFATVYGVADPSFGRGLYSLNLSYAPVPVPAAAWLFASGLVWLRMRRRKETVINAR